MDIGGTDCPAGLSLAVGGARMTGGVIVVGCVSVLGIWFLIWCVLRTSRDREADRLLGKRRKSYGNPDPPRFMRSLDRDGRLVTEVKRDLQNLVRDELRNSPQGL